MYSSTLTVPTENKQGQSPPDMSAQHASHSQLSDQTDEELIQQVKAGAQYAFRYLVERYQDRVATTVKAMLGDTEEAIDVGQETFIRFYKALDSFRGDSGVGTYLNRIAINLSLNALKRRKRLFSRFQHTEDQDLFLSDTTIDIDAREKQELIQQALLKLQPSFRSVVVLRFIEGYSTKETAVLLDVPIGTVLSRLSRAQKKMREWLLPYMTDEEK